MVDGIYVRRKATTLVTDTILSFLPFSAKGKKFTKETISWQCCSRQGKGHFTSKALCMKKAGDLHAFQKSIGKEVFCLSSSIDRAFLSLPFLLYRLLCTHLCLQTFVKYICCVQTHTLSSSYILSLHTHKAHTPTKRPEWYALFMAGSFQVDSHIFALQLVWQCDWLDSSQIHSMTFMALVFGGSVRPPPLLCRFVLCGYHWQGIICPLIHKLTCILLYHAIMLFCCVYLLNTLNHGNCFYPKVFKFRCDHSLYLSNKYFSDTHQGWSKSCLSEIRQINSALRKLKSLWENLPDRWKVRTSGRWSNVSPCRPRAVRTATFSQHKTHKTKDACWVDGLGQVGREQSRHKML